MGNFSLEGLDLRAILRGIWRRHKFLVAGIFLGIAIPSLTYVYLNTRPLYVSSATVAQEVSLFDRMPQFREVGTTTNAPNLLLVLRSLSFSEAVIEVLPNESLEELIGKAQYRDYLLTLRNTVKGWLGRPKTVLSPQQQAVEELRNARMQFAPVRESPGVLIIRGRASSARVAMDLVNTHIQVLLSRTRSTDQENANRTRAFLEQQVKHVKDSLTQSENALAMLDQQTGRNRLASPAGQGLDRLAQAESALAEAQASRELTLAKISVLRQSLQQAKEKGVKPSPDNQGKEKNGPGSVSSVTENQARFNAYNSAQQRLARLEEKLGALRERYTEAHPLVQSTQREVISEQVRVAQLARDLPAGPLPIAARGTPASPLPGLDLAESQRQFASLEAEEAVTQAQIDILQRQVDELRKKLGKLSREEVEQNNLRRTVESGRSILVALTDRLMAARVREQGEVGKVRVIDPASFPLHPTHSQSVNYALIALVLAVSLAFGTAFSIEYWRLPVETESDILKTTNLPVLGSISVMKPGNLERTTQGNHSSSRFPLQLHNSSGPGKINKELYRAIRANVETERLKSPFRSILVSSPGPSEGKSTTVINLAHVFQDFGRRVLIIDGDLRRPALHRTLSVTNKPGLADFVDGQATFDQVSRVLPSGITLIPGQVVREDPASVLASTRFRILLNPPGRQFDLVLIDSPPLLAVPDNFLLATAVDRVILVLKASGTSTRDLRKSHAILQKLNAKILGVILNQANRRDVDYYHRRYRKYYRPDDGKAALDSSRRAALLSWKGKS